MLRLKEKRGSYLRKNSGAVTMLCIINSVQHANHGSISHSQSYLCQKLLRLKVVTAEVPRPCSWYQLLLWKQYFQRSFFPFQDQITDQIFSTLFIWMHIKSQGQIKETHTKRNKTKPKSTLQDLPKLQPNLSAFWKLNHQLKHKYND